MSTRERSCRMVIFSVLPNRENTGTELIEQVLGHLPGTRLIWVWFPALHDCAPSTARSDLRVHNQEWAVSPTKRKIEESQNNSTQWKGESNETNLHSHSSWVHSLCGGFQEWVGHSLMWHFESLDSLLWNLLPTKKAKSLNEVIIWQSQKEGSNKLYEVLLSQSFTFLLWHKNFLRNYHKVDHFRKLECICGYKASSSIALCTMTAWEFFTEILMRINKELIRWF